MSNLNTTTRAFLQLLNSFEYYFTGYDKIWNVIFPLSPRKWVHVNVDLYNGKYFINELMQSYPSIEMDASEIEVTKNKVFPSRSDMEVKDWELVFQKAIIYLQKVKKNWLFENALFQNNFPLKYRQGIIPHSVVNAYFPDLIDIKKIVGNSNANQIIKIIESNYFRRDDELTLKTFNANQYFNYCKVAYDAIEKKTSANKNLDGKKLYKIYADNRHEGLLDIKADSNKEFATWLDGSNPKRTSGGHPWEILRGGSHTQVNLEVSRPEYSIKEGFLVHLNGNSINRLKEVVSIAVALKKAGLPFMLYDSENLRLRLLAQDYIGIVADHDTVNRHNHEFSEDNVTDVIYLDNIKSKLKVLAPFIIWEPLPVLKPIF